MDVRGRHGGIGRSQPSSDQPGDGAGQHVARPARRQDRPAGGVRPDPTTRFGHHGPRTLQQDRAAELGGGLPGVPDPVLLDLLRGQPCQSSELTRVRRDHHVGGPFGKQGTSPGEGVEPVRVQDDRHGALGHQPAYQLDGRPVRGQSRAHRHRVHPFEPFTQRLPCALVDRAFLGLR